MKINEFMLATGLTSALSKRWYHPVLVAMETYGIDSPLRQAHFLAQAGTESGGFLRILESLDYSVEELKIFYPRLSQAKREKLGRNDSHAALSLTCQADIAEIVYGDRHGNIHQGDGWKYRGRGLLQIRFRDNYAACGKILGLDLESHPDLLLDEMNAACSAGWFWKFMNCNHFADCDDVYGLTRCISGGSTGLKERIKRTLQALTVLLPG